MRLSHRRVSGFTLIEMIITIGLISILGAIAVPWFTGLLRRSALTSVVRRLAGDLQNAKVYAVSGRQITGSPNVRSRSGGLIILDDHQYQLFVDADVANGSEDLLTLINIQTRAPFARITTPSPGTILRFKNDGTFVGLGPIRIQDSEFNLSEIVEISGVGSIKVIPE